MASSVGNVADSTGEQKPLNNNKYYTNHYKPRLFQYKASHYLLMLCLLCFYTDSWLS